MIRIDKTLFIGSESYVPPTMRIMALRLEAFCASNDGAANTEDYLEKDIWAEEDFWGL